jgi:hypothetical protein
MQEALRFNFPEAEPVDRADYVERLVSRVAADHPRLEKIVRR